ncbi:MAG: WD40 repeat domain-containing protein, partial [Thermoanaerobaculales bacterium]
WPLAGTSGERSWVLDQAEGTFALAWRLAMAPDASFVVAGNSYGQVKDLPLDGGSICDLSGFTDGIRPIAIGPQSRLVAAGSGGGKIAVSPDGQRVASGGEGNSIRLWPMPDLSRPPLHTLPRSELIAKLKTLTNLRVVR